MGLLDSADVDYIRECLGDIASDVEEAITYKRYTGTVAGDPIAGTPDSYNYTNQATTAISRELTLKEVTVSGGAYVLGDMEFKFREAALSSAPDYPDRIVYGGATFKPKSIEHSYLGGLLGWKVIAGKQ